MKVRRDLHLKVHRDLHLKVRRDLYPKVRRDLYLKVHGDLLVIMGVRHPYMLGLNRFSAAVDCSAPSSFLLTGSL